MRQRSVDDETLKKKNSTLMMKEEDISPAQFT